MDAEKPIVTVATKVNRGAAERLRLSLTEAEPD